MKKLFTILLVTILTSCGSSLQPPKNNSDYKNIIGKSVKIGILEIAEYDFPERMKWDNAEEACHALGKGWRLPTKEELNILYKNKDKIGGFAEDLYWSSTEADGYYAWLQYFYGGSQYNYGKDYTGYVRAVRAF